MNLAKILLDFLEKEKFFTEVIAVPGAPPKVRRNEKLTSLGEEIVKPEQTKGALIYLKELAGKISALEKRGIFTFAYRNVGRIRVIYGSQRGSYYLSLLKVPFNPPLVEDFFTYPQKFEKFAEAVYHERGKVYAVFGGDWFLNATFIFEILNYVLKKGDRIVYTLENPTAYLLKHENGLTIQREMFEDFFQLEEALQDIPLIVPDFVYYFDALNIYTTDFGRVLKYIHRSANVFFNFPLKEKVVIRKLLEEKGLNGIIPVELSIDYRLGLVDFNPLPPI
jgi:twitching motility protein PilT